MEGGVGDGGKARGRVKRERQVGNGGVIFYLIVCCHFLVNWGEWGLGSDWVAWVREDGMRGLEGGWVGR